MTDTKEFLALAKEAALKAGQLIKDKLENGFSISHKANVFDVVTDADKESEKLIVGMLQERFPDHGIVGEEGTISEEDAHQDADYVWHIDPVDGTSNYSRGYPYFCVSIGLAKNHKPVVGVVYDPIADELFYAAAGKGAFLNDKPIHVSDVDEPSKAIVANGLTNSRKEDIDVLLHNYSVLITTCIGYKQLGSAALDICNVARGRTEGYFAVRIKSWDAAAGCIILREAGGECIDLKGGEWTCLSTDGFYTNGKIAVRLLPQLKRIKTSERG